MTEWTNIKTLSAGAAGFSTIYTADWNTFTTEELRQHFDLYVLQGLAPPAYVEYKSKFQQYIIYNAFNSYAERIHNHSKTFILACCDPIIAPST